MNFDDVPFTPDLDEPTENDSESTQESSTSEETLKKIDITIEQTPDNTEDYLFSSNTTKQTTVEVEINNVIIESNATETIANNNDENSDSSEITIDEDDDEQEEVVVDTDQENIGESEYIDDSTNPVETVNENFFDDL